MTNLNPDFCRRVKEARRNAGLSQSELAVEVGCKQSAISMFEQGDGTKLNDDVIAKLSKKFGIEISTGGPEPAAARQLTGAVAAANTAFCPNPHCPSNKAYSVDGRVLLRPDRIVADPAGGRFCALCGEVLERHCPNCGAEVHDGAICSFCGEPYVIHG